MRTTAEVVIANQAQAAIGSEDVFPNPFPNMQALRTAKNWAIPNMSPPTAGHIPPAPTVVPLARRLCQIPTPTAAANVNAICSQNIYG